MSDENPVVLDEHTYNRVINTITTVANDFDFQPEFTFHADGTFETFWRFGRRFRRQQYL